LSDSDHNEQLAAQQPKRGTGVPAGPPYDMPLYAPREKIYARRVRGFYRSLKWWIMAITLGIYYITPWIRWDRGSYAPDQAVLVDLVHRRFFFFTIEIWPQEFFFVAGMLVMAGVGLFLVTSVAGRAWCGYTCPQTVWVDLFLSIERFIEGDRNARIKLDKAPMSVEKLTKKTIKHAIFLLVSVSTGGAWVFYFADAPQLAADILTGQAAWAAYGTIAVLTGTTYGLGALMREQVCTYMCPWPRIQAAMLDDKSLIVTYNDWRGEPRGKHRKRAEPGSLGDCIDCNACVAVCPQGIDIRDGLQLECITCALCIDACNGIMDKVGQPRGLISYATLEAYNANMALAGAVPVKDDTQGHGWDLSSLNPLKVRNEAGALVANLAHTTWRSFFRLRTFIYIAVYGAIGLGLLAALATRDRLDLNVNHDRNPQFVTLSDGSIRNGYEVKVANMLASPRSFDIRVEGLEGAELYAPLLSGAQEPSWSPSLSVDVPADETLTFHMFLRLDGQAAATAPERFNFVLKDAGSDERMLEAAEFERPTP
jgi:cytochrome c oxidase accessory protein FixG